MPRPYGRNGIACGPTRSPPKRRERLRWALGPSTLDTRNTVITRRGEATPRPRSAVSRHSGTGEAWPRPYERNDIACGPTRSLPKRRERLRWALGPSTWTLETRSSPVGARPRLARDRPCRDEPSKGEAWSLRGRTQFRAVGVTARTKKCLKSITCVRFTPKMRAYSLNCVTPAQRNFLPRRLHASPHGPNDIACGPTRSPPKRSECPSREH